MKISLFLQLFRKFFVEFLMSNGIAIEVVKIMQKGFDEASAKALLELIKEYKK